MCAWDYDLYAYDITYIYDCSVCKREVERSIVLKCEICYEKVCQACYIKGFCLTHYNEISAEGKSLIDEVHNDYISKKKEIRNKCLWILFLPVIFFIFSFIHLFIYLRLAPSFVFFLLILIIVSFTVGSIYVPKAKENMREYKKLKFVIYRKYRKPLIQKSSNQKNSSFKSYKLCIKCESSLKKEANYCDMCGYEQ